MFLKECLLFYSWFSFWNHLNTCIEFLRRICREWDITNFTHSFVVFYLTSIQHYSKIADIKSQSLSHCTKPTVLLSKWWKWHHRNCQQWIPIVVRVISKSPPHLDFLLPIRTTKRLYPRVSPFDLWIESIILPYSLHILDLQELISIFLSQFQWSLYGIRSIRLCPVLLIESNSKKAK